MSSVVEADGENLNGAQGSQKFGDFDFIAGGLKSAEQVAFQKKGGAVCLEFRICDPA